jgi:hypothetical protein
VEGGLIESLTVALAVGAVVDSSAGAAGVVHSHLLPHMAVASLPLGLQKGVELLARSLLELGEPLQLGLILSLFQELIVLFDPLPQTTCAVPYTRREVIQV